MRKNRAIVLILSLFLVCTFVAVAEGAGEKESAAEVPKTIQPGTKISVFVDGGHNVVPFELFKDKIKELSGIELVLNTVAQADLYTKLKNELVSGTGAFDVIVYFPAALPELVNLGNLRPMDDLLVIRDPKLDDIITSYRALYCTYNGKLYGLPYDGDVHVYYYRKDLIEDPTEKKNFKGKYGYELGVPQTWEQQKDFAQFFTRKTGETLAGQKLTNDFYGNGMLLGRIWCAYEFLDHFGGYGGIYFDKNLKPMINSEIGLKTLADLKALKAFAPPGVLSWGYTETKGGFLGGNLASMISWTDIFKGSFNEAESSVAGKVGVSHIPGRMVAGKLEYKAGMPHGRVMSIVSTTKHPAEAFWVASYMSQYASGEYTLDPRTGEDPFRYSTVNNPEKLVEYLSQFSGGVKVPLADCRNYLEGIKASLENGYPALNIPGQAEYMDILDLYIHKALSGEMGDKEALDQVAKEWSKISDSLGFDSQKAIWNSALKSWKDLGYVK